MVAWSTVLKRSPWNRSHGFSPNVTSTEITLTTLAKTCSLSLIPSGTHYPLSLPNCRPLIPFPLWIILTPLIST
uniref:Uncharacterized protein n=1 Tax=Piliocolobus tephrosceles TaxID=591936 RepID=A0A8C9GCB5_9PRIM